MTVRAPITPGQRFGKLTILAEVRLPGRKGYFYECACECGGAVTKYAGHLKNGTAKSCGCIVSGHQNLRHGKSHSPEYRAWDNARDRCRNPANRKFPLYGGRGIRMCPEWAGSFDAFYAAMGDRPGAGYSLDRIDGDGHYEPGNCRWATIVEQNNNRSCNRFVTVGGERLTVAQAARATGVNRHTIWDRLAAGKSDEEAVRA